MSTGAKHKIVYECGCGNKFEEKIKSEAPVFEKRMLICNKCPGQRTYLNPMNARTEAYMDVEEPAKKK